MSIWTTTDPSVRRQAIQDEIDALLETSVNYEGTVDGAYVFAAASLARRTDEGVLLVLGALDVDTAPTKALVAMARRKRLTPGAAQPHRVLVELAGDEGAVFRSDARLKDDASRIWTIRRVVSGNGSAAVQVPFDAGQLAFVDGMRLELEVATAGQLAGVPTSFAFSPAVQGLDVDPASPILTVQTGRDAESTSSLRQRVKGASPGGTIPGLRAALLDVPGVIAADVVRTAPGVLRASVAYEGALLDTVAVGDALARHAPGAAALEGDQVVTAVGPDGRPVEVRFDAQLTQTVVVRGVLRRDGTVSDADVREAARAAVNQQVFASLTAGDPARWLYAVSATRVAGVVGFVSFTLDGGTADVSPATASTLLLPDIAFTTVLE